jgi:hypothetical protein
MMISPAVAHLAIVFDLVGPQRGKGKCEQRSGSGAIVPAFSPYEAFLLDRFKLWDSHFDGRTHINAVSKPQTNHRFSIPCDRHRHFMQHHQMQRWWRLIASTDFGRMPKFLTDTRFGAIRSARAFIMRKHMINWEAKARSQLPASGQKALW